MNDDTDHLIQAIDKHIGNVTSHLQVIVYLLRGRPIEADFFQGMINRIGSERKRVCRQIAKEELKCPSKD